MSKTRTCVKLLESFTIDDQNKTLTISKENALTILKEAKIILYILDHNNTQEVLDDLKKFNHITNSNLDIKIQKIGWNFEIADKFQGYFNKLLDFKNENLLEKMLVCKVKNSDINNDNLLLNLPKEIQNYIMSFVDASYIEQCHTANFAVSVIGDDEFKNVDNGDTNEDCCVIF